MNRRTASGHMDVSIVPLMLLVLGAVLVPNYWGVFPTWGRVAVCAAGVGLLSFFLYALTLPHGMASNARRQMEKERKRRR